MQNNRHAKNDNEFGTPAVPPIKEILALLMNGNAISHQDIINMYFGQKHRLAIAIQTLRDKYGFRDLIECPRSKNHPLANHYYIAACDMKEARKLAKEHNLIIRNSTNETK